MSDKFVLDTLDRKLLVELDTNARRSFTQLAKRLKTSKAVVAYRIAQLRKQGIISGFYTVVDTVRLGYPNYRIYLRFKNADLVRRKEIITAFVNEPSTWWVASTTYPWDLAAILLGESIHEANKKLQLLLDQFGENIAEYRLNPYVHLTHFPRDYILEEKPVAQRHRFVMGNESKIEINAMDRLILQELSVDARIGTVKLAKKLKTTPMVIKYAIKKLLKEKVILGFRVLLDYKKIGYEYYWLHVNVAANAKPLANYVCSLPNTVYFDETLGGSSVEFSVHLKREYDVQQLMNELIEKFGAKITDYNYFRVVKNEKVAYMPELMD
jgi:DNA-binding Lrp family transcriptional regulator